MCLAKSKVMALRLRLAWATSEIKAPSSSRTFVVMLYARYSMTSRGNSMPSAYIFFSKMAMRVSRDGT